jgi:CXXX repeat modification system protein
MSLIKVGIVSDKEKNEIVVLFERGIALRELAMSLDNLELEESEKENLKKSIKADLMATRETYDNWWKEKSEKYNWLSNENGSWSIDFMTNDIYLHEGAECECPN